MHKLQLQTPLSETAHIMKTPTVAVGRGGESSKAQPDSPLAAGQEGTRVLIQHEFARLMAMKAYTPNEAAILAVQNVIKRP